VQKRLGRPALRRNSAVEGLSALPPQASVQSSLSGPSTAARSLRTLMFNASIGVAGRSRRPSRYDGGVRCGFESESDGGFFPNVSVGKGVSAKWR